MAFIILYGDEYIAYRHDSAVEISQKSLNNIILTFGSANFLSTAKVAKFHIDIAI